MRAEKDSGSSDRLLVVGNGPTGQSVDGTYQVDLTCGHFLLDVAASGKKVQFLQPVEPLELALNYFGCVLNPHDVDVIGLDRRTPLAAFRTSLAALFAFARSDFVYLFYPGRLPRLAAALCRAIGKRYGVYVRGEKFALTGADGDLLRNAAFILAASQGIADRVAPLNGDVSLIRPMSTVSPDEAVQRDFSARKPGPLRLLFVGRLEADKGVPELLESAALLRQRGIPFELRLVGWGNLHRVLVERYADRSETGIFILGGIEDRAALMRLYEEADIFVLPTHHEGFPRVLYEAMVKSAVVVTTMVGGIPSLLRHEENCLAVPVGNAVAIADAIARLAASPSLMKRLADAALLATLDLLNSRPSHADILQQKLATATNTGTKPNARRRSKSDRFRPQQNI